MSFGGSSAYRNEAPKPLGVDEKKMSTNEQARPIPYWAGKQRFAVTFISEVFDVKKAAVERDSNAKKQARPVTSYFFSFVGLIGHGVMDGIHSVILNNEVVWEGTLQRDVDNPVYVDLTIEDYGLIRIYWGTEEQVQDPYLRYQFLLDAIPEHPPYRGMAYIVAHQLFAGFNQTNIQNLELIVSRYPTFETSPASINNDANPANVFVELLTNRRLGRGIESALLDTAAIVAVGEQLATEGLGCSPILNSQAEALEYVSRLFEYIDAYPIVSEDGLLSIGLIRPLIDQSGLPVVDESVMQEPLAISPEDWSTTFNEVNVKFTDPAFNYQPNTPEPWRDRGNFAITGQVNTHTAERPWVTSPSVAKFMAHAIGRMKALPEAKGRMRLRWTSLFDDLTPGALFKVNYPPRGYEELVCRVIERIVPDPALPSYEIEFKIDRSYLLNGLAVGEDEIIFSAAAEAEPIANLRAVELPVGLSPDGKPTLAVLAAKPEALSAGFKVHLGKNYDPSLGEIAPESYDVIGSTDRFAWRGVLTAGLDASEPLIDDSPGLQVQLTGLDTELDDMTPFDAMADDLLAFVGDEIFSISETEVVGVDAYRLSILRVRYGSQRESHAVGAECFIIRRSDLQQLHHPHFQPFNTAVLKIQAFTGQASADLDLETEHDVDITGRVYTEPPLANLVVDGNILNPTYGTGDDILITWTLTDGGELPHRSDLLSRVVILQFYNAAGDTLLGTTSTPGGELALTNAELQVLLGGEVTFLLKIKLRTISDWWEVESDTISLLVTKV